MLTALGSKEAEMRIIGCDLHASQQTIAMLDRETGEISEQTLKHEGETVRAFYRALPAPVVVGIEATGSMGWFVRLMEELGITCRVGHPAMIARPKRDGRNMIGATPICC
jgi:transposase